MFCVVRFFYRWMAKSNSVVDMNMYIFMFCSQDTAVKEILTTTLYTSYIQATVPSIWVSLRYDRTMSLLRRSIHYATIFYTNTVKSERKCSELCSCNTLKQPRLLKSTRILLLFHDFDNFHQIWIDFDSISQFNKQEKSDRRFRLRDMYLPKLIRQ